MKPAKSIILNCLFAVLLFGSPVAVHGTEIRFKDFGAVGDGTADDAAALERAVAALADAPKPVTLSFEAGRTYRIASGAGYAIVLTKLERVSIEGAGAILLLGAERRGVSVQACRDVTLRGLRFDYDPLPFAEARVTGSAPASRTVTAHIDEGFELPPAGGPTRAGGEQAYFAMLWNPGPHALRSTHYWVADLTYAADGGRSVSVVADANFRDWPVIRPGTTRITVPVRGIAHRHGGGAVIELDGNRDVALEDVEVWSAPWFACVVRRNEGSVTLRRVQIRPRPGTSRITSSWRDGVHVKGNRARLLFEECVLEGMNDDAFNIATFLSRVTDVEGARIRVRQNFPLEYVPWRSGDTLAGIATNSGMRVENIRVLAVEETPGANPRHAPEVTLTLERAVPGLARGDSVWALEAANPDTTLRRCAIRMSCRFQSRVTLEQCDITALSWFYGERIEGPLPSGSVVRQCRLRLGRGNAEVAVSCNGRINGLPAPAAAPGTPALSDLLFEENEIDGRFELRHALRVDLVNNRFAPERGLLTLDMCREVSLKGNRLGDSPLPSDRIRIQDSSTRDSIRVQ